jgi:signal transduction histidine kinase
MRLLSSVRQRAWIATLLMATITWLGVAQGPLRWLENWVSDVRLVLMSPREDASSAVVVLSINEDTLKAFPYRSPVSRTFIASLVKTLEDKGARAIGMDFLFDQPTEADADQALKDALHETRTPIFVGYTDATHLTADQSDFLETFTTGLQRASVDIPMDNADGVVRDAVSGKTSERGVFLPGLALAMARVAKGPTFTFEDPAPIRYRGIPSEADSFQPTTTVIHYPAHALAALPDDWIRDKYILVGADFPLSSEDRWRTPYASVVGFRDGQLPGVMLHALVLAQLLEDRQFIKPPAALELLIYVLVCTLVLLTTRNDRSQKLVAVLLALGLGGFWLSGFAAFRFWGLQLPLMGPTLAGLLLAGWRLTQQVKLFRRKHEEAQALAFKNQQIALELAMNYSKKLEVDVRQRTAELVATQQKLIAHEKAAALGVFTAGMAHEINNPANFVAAGVQNAEAETTRLRSFVDELLSEDADPDISHVFGTHFRKIGDAHDLVKNGINRIVTIIRNLRATHPEGDVGMQPAALADAIMTAWTVVSPTVAAKADLHTGFECSAVVLCKIADVTQVFIAVFLNALHAIEDAGHDTSGRITVNLKQEGNEVWVLVTDNGTGIPADTLDKVFDPFFTTKTVGRGTGLGLSMSRDIIGMHGGRMTIRSMPGESTTVEIALPLHDRLD